MTHCQLAKSGSTDDIVIILQGHISSPCQFALRAASLKNITFGPITVRKAHIKFSNSKTCTSNLQYTVVIKGDVELAFRCHKLLFNTEIHKTSTSLEMVAILNGWYYPFGLSWLGIGNGELRLKHTPDMSTLLTARFDLKINGKDIGANVAFGMDIKKQGVGYICGEMAVLTLGSLLKGFNIWLSSKPLPRVIRDMAFPRGVTVSYTISTIDNRVPVPSICKTLPVGFALSGEFQFLGLKLHLEIIVNGLSMSAEASIKPIEFSSGNVTVYKSQSDLTRGPALTVTVERNPTFSFQVSIRGYLVLRDVFSTEAQIIFTHSEVIAEMRVNISYYEVSLKLYGPYRSLLSYLAFRRLAGSLETSSLQWIGRKLEDLIRQASKAATDFIAGLQRKFSSTAAALERAQELLTNRQQAVDSAKKRLEGPLNTLKAAQRNLEDLCQIRLCDDGEKLILVVFPVFLAYVAYILQFASVAQDGMAVARKFWVFALVALFGAVVALQFPIRYVLVQTHCVVRHEWQPTLHSNWQRKRTMWSFFRSMQRILL